MDQSYKKTPVILLAEDDPGDQELTCRALEHGKFKNKLHIVNDGEEALDYLLRRNKYKNPSTSPTPDMFLLDLNMPKVDGKKVLEELKNYPKFSKMVTIVLTTSQAQEDIISSYNLGVKSYITKPVAFNRYIKTIQFLERYWFQLVALPEYKE